MGVFDGIKVADFSWAAVGPVPGRILADHGATVVRVESINWLEIARVLPPWKDFRFGEPNTSGLYPLYNTNKYGAALNLRHPRAAEVAHRFVEWADVFTTAAGPGFMKRLGLDYESVSKVKPDIIYYATSMQGQTGSHSRHVAYGSHTAALCGFVGLAGWPDRDPAMLYGAYTDWFTPRYAVTVLIAALDRRRKTGQGMYIDHAQYETAIHFLEPIVLDYTVNGRVFTRNGNYDPYAAPHGAYRCRGEDRWVAIAVTSDEEWQGLCRVLGEPEWTREERFATLSGRLTNHAELDRLRKAGVSLLERAAAQEKDQSYVLYGLGGEELSRCLFPNGEMSKEEVREFAAAHGLAAARSEESQEICFLCGGDYRDLVSRRHPEALAPGPVEDTSGKRLGEHRGVAFFTVGQRRGLGVSMPYPLYVVALDASRSAVIVGGRDEVPGDRLRAEMLHWTAGHIPGDPFAAQAMVRYNSVPTPCRVEVSGDVFELSFAERVWALTPGQHAVLYRGDEVLGGGVIAAVS